MKYLIGIPNTNRIVYKKDHFILRSGMCAGGRAKGKPGAVCLHPAASEKREGKEGLGYSLKEEQCGGNTEPQLDRDRDGRPVSSLIASSVAIIIKYSCSSAYV